MFYIEKDDKPNFIRNILGVTNDKNNIIYITKIEKMNNKKLKRIAYKTNKIIKKNSNSKKVILSKDIQEQKEYVDLLNSYGFEIQDGKFLYEILIPNIVEYIIQKQNVKKKKYRISILINDVNEIEVENIKLLARKYDYLNITTNHIEKYRKIEKQLLEEGIIITITNNKKKSLRASDIIINVDFPTELINKYIIKDDVVIINVKNKIKINKKRFNGLCINNYEINYKEELKDIKIESNKYFLRDIYESQFYKQRNIQNIRKRLKEDDVIINKLFLNNSII